MKEEKLPKANPIRWASWAIWGSLAYMIAEISMIDRNNPTITAGSGISIIKVIVNGIKRKRMANTPNMAADAPTMGVLDEGFMRTCPKPANIPDAIYIAPRRVAPISFSTIVPTPQRAKELDSRWVKFP
jgi:hypothetical protein